MFGFAPLASAPFAEDGAVSVTATAIVAGVPTVNATGLTQKHSLQQTSIVIGVPTLASSSIAQTQVISPSTITTGVPVVGQPTAQQTHGLSADGITSGVPVVNTAVLTVSTVQNLFTSSIVAGTPELQTAGLSQTNKFVPANINTPSATVSQASATQRHELSGNGVSSGNPALGIGGLTQKHLFGVDSLITGQIQVNVVQLGQKYNLTPSVLSAQAPQVTSADISIRVYDPNDFFRGRMGYVPSMASRVISADNDNKRASYIPAEFSRVVAISSH